MNFFSFYFEKFFNNDQSIVKKLNSHPSKPSKKKNSLIFVKYYNYLNWNQISGKDGDGVTGLKSQTYAQIFNFLAQFGEELFEE